MSLFRMAQSFGLFRMALSLTSFCILLACVTSAVVHDNVKDVILIAPLMYLSALGLVATAAVWRSKL